MTKLFIDTNIVIDLLAKRPNFYAEAAALFSLSDKQHLMLFTSSLTFANTHYIVSKQTSTRQTKEVLRKFKILVETLSLDDKIIDLALSDDYFRDFEDGLQYFTAIENQADAIITRNKKDFKHSKIPVLTAKEFLSNAYS